MANYGEPDHNDHDHGNDSESSGFGDFCGFNLDEDLSEDIECGDDDDELERPGKTYEFVNFVDPKYADGSSTRRRKININHQHQHQNKETQLVHHEWQVSQSSSVHCAEQQQQQLPAIALQVSKHEIPAAHMHEVDPNPQGGTLNEERGRILNERRARRRYVWKDASLFDITLVIASPCIVPHDRTGIGIGTPAPSSSPLQYFDMKAFESLLFDGILCSIHQTCRLRTLQGTLGNVCTRAHGSKLLHFVGHARDGQLLLECDDAVGQGEWCRPAPSATAPLLLDKMTQCVVVQSPTHVECADIFVRQLRVKHVIAIKQPEDNFAHHVTDFLTQFYFALIESNTTVARAFRTALKLFDDDNDSIPAKYRASVEHDFQLLPPESDTVDHELILFRPKLFRDGKPTQHGTQLAPHNNIAAIRPFVGRWREIYTLMNIIRHKKLVSMVSPSDGTGKQALITMAARYLWQRDKFKGGVFHIKCSSSSDNGSGTTNFAELILQALRAGGIGSDAYAQVQSFYDRYRAENKDSTRTARWHILAVEILYFYVTRSTKLTHSVCVVFSDFDQLPFAAHVKYAFVSYFIQRFDDELETPPQFGSRLIVSMSQHSCMGDLHFFMDHCYSYSRAEATEIPRYVIVDGSFGDGSSHGRPPSQSEPAKRQRRGRHKQYIAADSMTMTNRQHDFNRLPMTYKRGYKLIDALSEEHLIRLFLQMIHVADTDTVYTFAQCQQHRALVALFAHQPLKVKQIAEHVLQAFDDNLSRQHYQYEENEEAGYGLVYMHDDDTDSDFDEDDDDDDVAIDDEEEEEQENEHAPWRQQRPFIVSAPEREIVSILDLKLENNLSNMLLQPRLSENVSSESVPVSGKRRRSRLTAVVSLKYTKTAESIKLSVSRLSNLSILSAHTHTRFVSDLKTPATVAVSAKSPSTAFPVVLPLTPCTGTAAATDKRQMVSCDMFDAEDEVINTLPTIDSLHESNPVWNLGDSQKSPRQLQLNVVPSEDCQILLTKPHLGDRTLSSKNVCVDMAFGPMDYKKTYIRQKIEFVRAEMVTQLARDREQVDPVSRALRNNQSYHQIAFPSRKQLPNLSVGSVNFRNSELQAAVDAEPNFARSSSKLVIRVDPTPASGQPVTHPKLVFNNSIPVPAPAPTESVCEVESKHSSEKSRIEDSIMAAWPTLDDVVRGFQKLQSEREQANTAASHQNSNALKTPAVNPESESRFDPFMHRSQPLLTQSTQPQPLLQSTLPSVAMALPMPAHVVDYSGSSTILPAIPTQIISSPKSTHNRRPNNNMARAPQQAIVKIWEACGGTMQSTLPLEDFIHEMFNHFVSRTENSALQFDLQSIAPYIGQFTMGNTGMDAIDVHAFQRVWHWLNSVSEIVNESPHFWSVAAHHGFIDEVTAKQLLVRCKNGTFIIRFAAPRIGLVILYKNNAGVAQYTLNRKNNSNVYSCSESKSRCTFTQWMKILDQCQYVYSATNLKHKSKFF